MQIRKVCKKNAQCYYSRASMKPRKISTNEY